MFAELRWTGDDPAASPSWSAWTPTLAADITARAFQARLRLVAVNPVVTPVVRAARIELDMPDRIESADDVAVPVDGLAIGFAPAFRATPSIVFSGQDLATGDYVVVSAKSAAGFTVHVFDSNGAPISRTIDWLARGYGFAT